MLFWQMKVRFSLEKLILHALHILSGQNITGRAVV